MGTKLDWQTGDEAAWEEEPAVAETAGPRSRRWLLIAGIVVLLLCVSGWVLYQQAKQRLATAAQAAEVDVLSSHRLVQQAVAQGDRELLRLVLSAGDPPWTKEQEDLLAAGLLFAPIPFGFRPLPEKAAPDEPDVTLSPDFNAAEVTFTRPYAVEETGATVLLQYTAVYRRGEQRWLLSPPPPDFWNDQSYQMSTRLTLVYPRRDEAIARQLFAALDVTLSEMCRTLADLNCPPDLHVTLRLNYETPSHLAIPEAPMKPLVFGNNFRLGLPAPTLAGIPVDEAGYQALFRGYARHVVAAVVTQLVGYHCCQRGLFYQALLDKQLSQLGLRPWLDQATSPAQGDLTVYWETAGVTYPAPDVREQLYALVDFILAADPQNSPAAMQRRLGDFGSYHVWLSRFADGDHLARLLDVERLALVNPQSPVEDVAPPIPLANEPIHLVCKNDAERTTTLYRYDLASEFLRQEYLLVYPNDGFVNVTPLRRGQGYVVHEQVDGDTVSSWLALVQYGAETVIAENTANNVNLLSGMFFTGESDPTGRYLVLSSYGLDRAPELKLLDLDHCRPGDCPLQPLYGMPLWSPDGVKTLTLERTPVEDTLSRWWQTLIYRGDGWGQSLAMVGAGGSPFWLNDQRYGYVRLNSERETEVVTAAVNDGAAAVWIRPADLLAAIPADERPGSLTIWRVVPGPADAGMVALMASPTAADNVGPYTFFLVQGDGNRTRIDEVRLLFQADFPALPEFSPDGRWLIFTSRGVIVHLLDTMTGRPITIDPDGQGGTFSGWSAGSQWLLQKHDDYLSLVAPAHNYRLLAHRDLSDCYHVSWADGW